MKPLIPAPAQPVKLFVLLSLLLLLGMFSAISTALAQTILFTARGGWAEPRGDFSWLRRMVALLLFTLAIVPLATEVRSKSIVLLTRNFSGCDSRLFSRPLEHVRTFLQPIHRSAPEFLRNLFQFKTAEGMAKG